MCVITSLALEVEGRPDIVIDLTAPGSVEALKEKPFVIKEGAEFRMKAQFRVQHQVLSGLKYVQAVKRKGIRVAKDEEMLVSICATGTKLGDVRCLMLTAAAGKLRTEYRGQADLRKEM